MLQTRFPFTLPFGYLDVDGEPHRQGFMRMATAYDEIAPLKDPRVQANPGYLAIILLSRVIEIDGLDVINPKVVEKLFAGDVYFLQEMYRRINTNGHNRLGVRCPHCDQLFGVDVGEVDSAGGD